MGRLNGKVAVITGATSGIGLRTAEVFVAEGAKIIIAGRRVAEGEALAKKLGANCVFRQTDVTVEEQMRALIALAIEKFGRLDCLFNNAGGPAQTGGIEGLDVARFDAAMATLVRSVMLGRMGSDNERVSSKRLVLHPICSASHDRSKAKMQDH